MKIVIRPAMMRKGHYVAHVVNNDDSDVEEYGKVTLQNETAYRAFKELLTMPPDAIREELGNLQEGLASIQTGNRYLPPEGSLLIRLLAPAEGDLMGTVSSPAEAAAAQFAGGEINKMELENLAGVIGLIQKMREGASNITIEDRMDKSPQTVKVTAKRDGDAIALEFAANFGQITAMGQALSGENYHAVHDITKLGTGFSTQKGGGAIMRFETADAAIGVLNLLNNALTDEFFASGMNISKARPFALEGVRQVAIDARAIAQEIAKGKQ